MSKVSRVRLRSPDQAEWARPLLSLLKGPRDSSVGCGLSHSVFWCPSHLALKRGYRGWPGSGRGRREGRAGRPPSSGLGRQLIIQLSLPG